MPSTAIRDFSYDETRRQLLVTFITGRRYIYSDVPPGEAKRFRAAFSKGQHFNANIRDRYSYRELEPSETDSS